MSSNGEGLPVGGFGERTPLRSLDNEMFHLSASSSRLRSKSLLNADAVKTKVDVPLCDQAPCLPTPLSTNIMQPEPPPFDETTESACGPGDVTFKSFVCPGGEVEITSSSTCKEESISLTQDQALGNPVSTEDTFLSDSIIVQSCSDHEEHPYYKPEVENTSLVESEAAVLFEIFNRTLNTDTHADQDLLENITWKSFSCDGGEIEVPNLTRLEKETIPLPLEQLCEHLGEVSINQTNLSECGPLFDVEHADHPYCSNENSVQVITRYLNSASEAQKPTGDLSNLTFKSMNFSGGEVKIAECIERAEETTPLPADQTRILAESCNCSTDLSVLAGEKDVLSSVDHADNPNCNGDLSIEQEPVSLDAVERIQHFSLIVQKQNSITSESFSNVQRKAEQCNGPQLSSLPDDEAVNFLPPDTNCVATSNTEDKVQDEDEEPDSLKEMNETPPALSTSTHPNSSLKASDNKSVSCHMLETSRKDSLHPDKSAPLSMLHQTNCPDSPAERAPESPMRSHASSEAKDSAFGSSGNVPVLCNSAEKPLAETLPDVLKVLSECPSAASVLPFGVLTPVVRRASLLLLKARKESEADRFLADDSAVEGEKSFAAPVNLGPASLFAELLESPMPRPLFNSTALPCRAQPGPLTEPAEDVDERQYDAPQPKVEKPVLDVPLIPDGPLQQQLRQMAEFLFLASGKMGPAAVSATMLPPPASTVPSTRAPSVESHSVCVGTTPMKQMDHSVNTSGTFERRREFSTADSCTLTDPLLWNVPPGSLECLPRQELEQRLRSSMIMVEALVQQLAAARIHPSAGAAPSDLREKLVQTDHTELSQSTIHRDLYLEALRRIGELELDESSLQNLTHCVQDIKDTMSSMSVDTDAALTNMKQIGDVVKEDHQSLRSHYGQMKSVFDKTKRMQTVMMQKVKDAFHQRDDMRSQMEDAFSAKDAAFSAMDQLRTTCASEISELERIVGSHQELLAALNQTHPEQAALNKIYSEILGSACDALSKTKEEHSSLMTELCTVRGLLKRAAPLLGGLNEKAAAALRECEEYMSERDQVVEERDQIAEEWSQANSDLQAAREQISDLNLQVTILTSEMGVLRQKIAERDEERGQLERKVTELSATVSSSLASYTFLEQALAAETTKLQQSWKDIQQSKDRANELEVSLGESEQRVCKLNQALAQREEQLAQLQALSQSQNLQIQQLQDVCTQLSGVREENEFLQMENELAREQMAESERVSRANLHALRERNIECEDLKGELVQLQIKSNRLQEELEATRSKAGTTQQELSERLAQAVTEITLLHHTLRGLTNELHTALSEQKLEPMTEKNYQAHLSVERRHPSTSFIDSIMVALTAEKEEVTETDPAPVISDPPGLQCETLFSETSAFTRIAVVTPKKHVNTGEFEHEEDDQSCETELFADLSCTITELIDNLKLLRERKDAQLEELNNNICVLQGELLAANSRHKTEVLELKHQLHRLNSQVEKGSQALQQKSQDEKTLMKLMSDVKEAQELLNKHKGDNNELRKEVADLRRSLQQSKVESQLLREELRKAGGQSANLAPFMEEKIQLLKEVERLKLSLQEVEQARVKLLDRAKRHQMIHQTNQQKSENELQMLNNMINRVRETLLSVPEIVKDSEQLQQLIEYIG